MTVLEQTLRSYAFLNDIAEHTFQVETSSFWAKELKI